MKNNALLRLWVFDEDIRHPQSRSCEKPKEAFCFDPLSKGPSTLQALLRHVPQVLVVVAIIRVDRKRGGFYHMVRSV